MEELLKQIIGLLVGVIVLLAILVTCQICLVIDAIEPPRAEAESKLPAQKVDLVKIGGRPVFLNDILGR